MEKLFNGNIIVISYLLSNTVACIVIIVILFHYSTQLMPEHKTGKQTIIIVSQLSLIIHSPSTNRENRRTERKEKQKGRKQKKNFIPIC